MFSSSYAALSYSPRVVAPVLYLLVIYFSGHLFMFCVICSLCMLVVVAGTCERFGFGWFFLFSLFSCVVLYYFVSDL